MSPKKHRNSYVDILFAQYCKQRVCFKIVHGITGYTMSKSDLTFRVGKRTAQLSAHPQ